MAGSARYNGPGAALRGQPRAPRQPSRRADDGHTSSAADTPSSRAHPDSKYDGPKDLADMASPRSYTSGPSHQRQWSDTSSLQGGGLPPHAHPNYPPSQNYPYNEHSPYMGPASGSPASPPPLSPSHSTASSYFHPADQRSHAPSQRQHQRGNQYGPGSAASSVLGSATYSQYSNAPNGGGGGSRPGNNGYNSQYDQSPMMSPLSADSWRSPPGPRGYASQNTQYSPSTQYQPSQHHPYSAASSVVNDDHGHSNRARNYPYESDSDDYYNRQGGRNAPGQGQGRYGDDRGHALSYSTSIASNTSSVLAARRARNERNERNQRQTAAQVDEWLTSPTGTELDTEILPWSDDEAIVTKAVRSPPTGYVKEKNLPPIPYQGASQPQPQSSSATVGKMQQGKRIESDMIKVEIGGATSVIPTTEEGSGLTFVKSVPGSSSPPPGSRYNTAVPAPAPATQSMTGAATSLRAAAVFNEQKTLENNVAKQDPSRAQRPGQRLSSDWDGQRISLDDMLSASSPMPRDGRQQAIDSWRTSPPLRAREEKAAFTDLKSKRRSSLPDKVVPNWNEHAQNWRSSIGQRRPSWMASSMGAHDGPQDGKANDMDDFMAQKKKWADHGLQSSLDKNRADGKAKDKLEDAKRLSDQSSLHRRSRSWSPRPLDKNRPATATRHRDSFASTVSRSRSRSGSRPYNRHSHRSFSRSRSRSRSRSIRSGRSRSGSRSRAVSLSRSRSRSPAVRGGNDLRNGDGPSAKGGQERSSSRFSWHSTSDINPNRRSWESAAHEVKDDFKTNKAEGGLRDAGGPRYSTAGEEDLTDYDDDFSEKKLASRGLMSMRDGKSTKAGASGLPPVETKPASLHRGKVDEDSDADSLDSPPVKVQYARRAPSELEEEDDDRSMSSKYPASIISTFNLPPATSPISPQKPPPLPTPHHSSEDVKKSAAGGSVNDYMNYRPMAPPPVPDSPPQTPNAGQSLMTSITTVSIEAATATLSSSRVSVDSFKNVPGKSGAGAARGGLQDDTDLDSEFETDVESTGYKRDKMVLQPSYVSMTSTSGSSNHQAKLDHPTTGSAGPSPSSTQTSNPISITTTQLTRTESSASSVSVLSARSAKSFMSASSIHSASSILPGSPPPQRAPPPIPMTATTSSTTTNTASEGANAAFGGAKRSGSAGSARGVRSGLNKQILPPTVPPPPGPPPEAPGSSLNMTAGSKPSYGILPPPIPSSFNEPSSATTATAGAAAAVVAATTSSAVQIQMLADEDQSRSQMGAITVEHDEREMTRLNNRVAQLERELEFAQQDLEASQDDAVELQNKVHDLEAEIEELSLNKDRAVAAAAAAVPVGRNKDQELELESARDAWEQERSKLLEDLERLREDHQEELEDRLKKKQVQHEEALERLMSEHQASLETQRLNSEEEQSKRMQALEARLQAEHQEELEDALDHRVKELKAEHAEALEEHRSEHEARLIETRREWEERLEGAQEEHVQSVAALKVDHEEELRDLTQRLTDMEKLHLDTATERDQAVKDLAHHKKETEQALDQLEAVLADDKKTHAQLIQDLEKKSKGLEERVAELETQLEELMQDNVQIVEEMQRREDTWAQERALLRAGEGDVGEQEARLQEMHEQMVALTESKRQADVQFQGIVKGLLREASANKKELEARQELLDQERQGKEDLLEQLDQERQRKEDLLEQLDRERQSKEDLVHQLDQEREGKEQSLQQLSQVRQGNDGILHELEAIQSQVRVLEQEKEALYQEKQSLEHAKEALEREMHAVVETRAALEESHREMEARLETQQRSGNEAMANIQRELEDRVRQQEQALEAERAKARELEEALEQTLSKAGKDIQQEQFVWKTRLDQTEAALKTKEAQVRKLEQEADATIKLQTDLLQSMERDATNSNKKLEASLMGKMKEMEQSFEEEKRMIQQQMQQELQQRFELESVEKETRLQQQLESIHQQELSMAIQELSTKHEQQMRAMKQQHESALEQSNQHLKQQSQSIEDQIDKLQQQAEQERSEKEVALKDRTFLERRMAGHDRRQKELEMSLESLQQELDQARAKFGQELQDVERSRMNLERKLGMAKEDVEELNKIRDELENDRDELRQELHRLKKAGPGRSGPSSRSSASSSRDADASAAWEAEKRRLEETVRKLEDEVQIMLEKNMNLTIELSMR
ncbi:hypothetical protein EC968_006735 [Mortierella alpina]|nr:hypothetical protein EC968_006735 [Mortierella alpina]